MPYSEELRVFVRVGWWCGGGELAIQRLNLSSLRLTPSEQPDPAREYLWLLLDSLVR